MSLISPVQTFFEELHRAGLEGVVLGRHYDSRVEAELRLASLAPFARSGLLLVSGGSTFFEHFLRQKREEPDPLDAYTRRLVASLVEPLRREGIRVAVRHPFWNEADPLPFQRIARAAGLAPSLLGLDLHPRFGPWVAYRALLLLDLSLEESEVSNFEPCLGCAAPCIEVCPVGAVSRAGWDAKRCFDHRVDEGGCAEGCHSRLACPVGAEHRYAPPILRYFQASALACSPKSKNPNGAA